jgi:CrcB protein
VIFGVAAAGALGAVARYLLDGLVQRRVASVFPWGTFVVNVSGSLVLGVVAGLALSHGLDDTTHTVIAAGFCGGFTTYSTFAYESVRLVQHGSHLPAALNVVGSVFAGLAAAALGLALTGAL